MEKSIRHFCLCLKIGYCCADHCGNKRDQQNGTYCKNDLCFSCHIFHRHPPIRYYNIITENFVSKFIGSAYYKSER